MSLTLRSQMRYMNPYDLHKALVNEYILRRPGDTVLLKRDSSADRTDVDIIRENHKFLWDNETPDTWEAQFAKKYYDKLFKEYCIGDLSRYKANKIALRWRTEQEVIVGKGQFTCGNKRCASEEMLRTWEVNFAYQEQGQKKNALVKIRLCPDCSSKLNYHSKKREVKRFKNKQLLGQKRKSKHKELDELVLSNLSAEAGPSTQVPVDETVSNVPNVTGSSESPWDNIKPVEAKSRDEEMEDYLQELLL